MSLNFVDAGEIPDKINVIIEIPAHSDPVKYEIEKKSGALFVDRFMSTAMHYPCNYGYIPKTLGEDGDPLDVMVLAPFPLLSGSVIRCRPIGVMAMVDESGEDSKILAVPIEKLTKTYNNIKSVHDVAEETLQTIAHFFQHYKDLEPGKWAKVKGWQGIEEAKMEIIESVDRYKSGQVPA